MSIITKLAGKKEDRVGDGGERLGRKPAKEQLFWTMTGAEEAKPAKVQVFPIWIWLIHCHR
jgi:hypothetical protein